ncbi:MarR family transcriptional regulator, partial [Streptomyces sp. NPDC002920]
DPEGGMARKFRLTGEGTRLLDEEREGIVDILEQVMRDWPHDDIAAFASYLRRFNNGIEAIGGRPWPRP